VRQRVADHAQVRDVRLESRLGVDQLLWLTEHLDDRLSNVLQPSEPIDVVVQVVARVAGQVDDRELAVRKQAWCVGGAIEDPLTLLLQAGRDAVRQPFSLRSGATLASVPFRAAYNGLGAIIQAASYPILEHIVPRQKLGVFADLAKSELAKLPPGATPDVVREAMSKAWDSVENRMGQMTYDNLMWSRVTKDIAMISTRSVGWNLGTIRELGGGVIDLAKAADNTRLSERIGAVAESHRAAYAIALPAVVALHGAVLQYLMTGKAPESTKDYFFPRTGHLNPDGTEERVQLPSYMRDVYAYGEHPYETIKHKLHPLVSVIADMLENKDFRNNEIRNPDDPLVVQLGQEARYIAAQFKPMGVSNMQAARDRGEPVAEQAGAFVGVTPAPRDRTRTPAQLKMSELLQQSAPGGRTPEEVDASNAHRALVAGLRGGTPDARANVLAAVQGGEITPQTAIKTLKSGLTSTSEIESFKRLTATQAIEVWKVASPEEQARWRGAMLNKIVSAVKRGQQIAIPKGLVSDTTAPQTSLLSPPQKVSGGLLGSAIKSARSAGGLLGSALSGNRPGDVR